jgi:hypothetical protein
MPSTLVVVIFPRERLGGLLWLTYRENTSRLRDKHEGIVD